MWAGDGVLRPMNTFEGVLFTRLMALLAILTYEGWSLLWYMGLGKSGSPLLLFNLKHSGNSVPSWASLIQTWLQGVYSIPSLLPGG